MNPTVLWSIVCACFGIGGTAYGIDQNQKRKREQAANNARLQQIEAEFASKEEQLAELRTILGAKNEQVRILIAEVARLRSARDDMRRSA